MYRYLLCTCYYYLLLISYYCRNPNLGPEADPGPVSVVTPVYLLLLGTTDLNPHPDPEADPDPDPTARAPPRVLHPPARCPCPARCTRPARCIRPACCPAELTPLLLYTSDSARRPAVSGAVPACGARQSRGEP